MPVPFDEALDEPLALFRVEHFGGCEDGVQQPGGGLLRERELRGTNPFQRHVIELRTRELRDVRLLSSSWSSG